MNIIILFLHMEKIRNMDKDRQIQSPMRLQEIFPWLHYELSEALSSFLKMSKNICSKTNHDKS